MSSDTVYDTAENNNAVAWVAEHLEWAADLAFDDPKRFEQEAIPAAQESGIDPRKLRRWIKPHCDKRKAALVDNLPTSPEVLERYIHVLAEVAIDDPATFGAKIAPAAQGIPGFQEAIEELSDEIAKGRRAAANAEARERAERAGIPWLRRGDYAELAEALCNSYTVEVGNDLIPPAYDQGDFYHYNPETMFWEALSKEALSARLQGWAGLAMVVRTNKEGDENPVQLRVNNCKTPIEMTLARPIIWNQGKGFFDRAPKGIAFRNLFVGVSKTEHGLRLTESPRGPFNAARLGFDFDYTDEEPGPLFKDFLSALFANAPDEVERAQTLQEHLGTTLLGIAPMFQKALLLYGPPGCGKSTFLGLIEKAFPPGTTGALQPHTFGRGVTMDHLARLRANLVPELEQESGIRDIGAFKGVICGDPQTAEAKYKDPYTFRPDCGHIFCVNIDQFPSVPNADAAFWHRWHCVPFHNVFRGTSKEVVSIGNQILASPGELAGIMRWAIQGAHRAIKQGRYTHCPSGAAVIEELRWGANPVARFVNEVCDDVEPGSPASTWPTTKVLWQDYKQWAGDSDAKTRSLDGFTKALRALGVEIRKSGVWRVSKCHFTDKLSGPKS